MASIRETEGDKLPDIQLHNLGVQWTFPQALRSWMVLGYRGRGYGAILEANMQTKFRIGTEMSGAWISYGLPFGSFSCE
jgi:hypothetical protein